MAEHRRGANLPSIGGFNRTVVLDAVRRSPDGLSRVELAASTGLSAQTVSNVTRFLIEAGMIVESGTVVAGRGKPRTILRLEAASRYAVGVHVDPAVVTYVLLDLAGSVVAETTTSTPSADDPAEVVRTIATAVDGLVADAGVAVDSVLGVGIASPGPIDVDAGVVLDPPFLPRWRDVPLRDALAEATGFPVLLEKDVTAAVVGEMFLAGESSARNFAFVYFGTGFGVGLVVDHEPVRGVGSNAGDAGHIMVDQGALAGTPDGSGPRGEVGAAVAPARLVEVARDRGLHLTGGAPADDVTAVQRPGTPSATRSRPATRSPRDSPPTPAPRWAGPWWSSSTCSTSTAWSSAGRSGHGSPRSPCRPLARRSRDRPCSCRSTRSRSWTAGGVPTWPRSGPRAWCSTRRCHRVRARC